MSKNIGKNVNKNVGSKRRRQITPNHNKQPATQTFKITSKRTIQKTADATGNLIGNKIPKKVCNVSRTSLQNNSETITNQMENRKEIIDDLSLIY